jgi:sugar O-acyltransferase (sialic acid O-acetyltransferase NeuD family)
MHKDKIILIGGGGHCKSCIDVIEQENKYEIAGILDVKENIGKNVLGYTVIGSDDDIEELSKQYRSFLITIGQIKSAEKRISIYNRLEELNLILPVIISPLAYVSVHSNISDGTIVMHHAVINAGAFVGSNCIINTKALVEHDAVIGNNCHISTSAIINGECKVGDNCFIGSNAVISNLVKVENDCIIAAGSFVPRDLKIKGIYTGNPAINIM